MHPTQHSFTLPHGGMAAMVSLDVLDTTRQAVQALGERFPSGLLDTIARDFYDFDLTDAPFHPASIVVIVLPKPMVQVRFDHNGTTYRCFNDGCRADTLQLQDARDAVRRQLASAGHSAHDHDALPLKQLAVRSGLALYGRNNLAYVPGMGCLVQIAALLTDMPCENRGLPLARMRQCDRCGLCAQHCPTGAIDPGRPLIHADRCLTYFNEFIDLAPFPDWIPAAVHHSLHGCMRCQLCCPQNKPLLQRPAVHVAFSEPEAAILLRGARMDALHGMPAEKVRDLELEDYLDLLPRNMRSIMKARDEYNNSQM